MKTWGLGLSLFVLQAALICGVGAHFVSANDLVPDCLDKSGNDIAVNNDQVDAWKTSTPNNYLNRGHVTGTVTALYANQTGHAHFEIQMGSQSYDSLNDLLNQAADNPGNALEVVYDLAFGDIPDIQVGDTIEACGDYITAFAQSGPYPPSPDGALIHWIHKSDNLKKHADGFLMINGDLYGQDLPND